MKTAVFTLITQLRACRKRVVPQVAALSMTFSCRFRLTQQRPYEEGRNNKYVSFKIML